MRRKIRGVLYFPVLAGLMLGSCVHEKVGKEAESPLATHMDTISYCVGVVFASNLPRDGFDTIDTRRLAQGIHDYVDNKSPLIDAEQAKQLLLEEHKKKIIRHQLEKFNDNKIAGEKFLKENSKREGVVTLPSGLQYKILKEGKGPTPGPHDLVLVHYQGRLIDGTVFEDHLKGEPIPFFVDRMIKGWSEALQLMPEGSHWMIYVPYQLGYGSDPNPNSSIPPFSTLIFEIELVKVKKSKLN